MFICKTESVFVQFTKDVAKGCGITNVSENDLPGFPVLASAPNTTVTVTASIFCFGELG